MKSAIQQMPFKGEGDKAKMIALAHASAANNMHVVDWTYRFASWAFDAPENVALWVEDSDELIAWAVLQTPFWTIDYVMRPDAETSEIHHAILSWADARARSILNTRFGRPLWFVNVMAHQHDRIRDLESLGFANQADVGEDSFSKVLMTQTLEPDSQRVVSRLPTGYLIRPLAREREADAYVTLHRAVFESESMTSDWRKRTLTQPGYTPDLDLVLEALDGSLAGFCVCWLHGTQGQIEPMGLRADVRGTGLGKALLSEGLRRLIAHGATQLFVETDHQRDAAFALYQSVGFRVQHEVFVFRRDY